MVKSDKDNRYVISAVVSHDGVQMPCVAVPSLAAFREHVGEEEYRQVGKAFGKPLPNSPSHISSIFVDDFIVFCSAFFDEFQASCIWLKIL